MRLFYFIIILLMFYTNSIFSFINYSYTSNLLTIRTPLLPILENEHNFERISFSVKNIWSLQYEKFIIDGEEWEISYTKQLKFSNHFYAGGNIAYKLQTGGILDPLIESFHRFTGVTQQYREDYSKNKIFISYEPYGELYQFFDYTPYTKELRRKLRSYPRNGEQPPLFIPLPIITTKKTNYFIWNQMILPLEVIPVQNDNYDSFDNPKIYFLYEIFENYFQKLYMGIYTKIPVINKTNYFYSSGFDTSWFFSGSFYFKKNIEFLYGISYTYYELKKWQWIQMPDHQWSVRLQSNYYYRKQIFFLEYLFISKPILNLGRLSEDSHFISFGLITFYNNKKFTFSLIENVYFYASSPDIGFYFSVQWYK
ncbi:MAG: hypothetical protein KatS3mg129_2907 [Leptospiraceae bacterium]|nr:MAG: hypothetical protein KatS3mg129_2907 [Leptospiraceae bacterium]